MANQDPQPEIYTTRYAWLANTAAAPAGATIPAGTSQVVSIFTNQANNEEVRIYGLACRVFNTATGTASTTFNDFAVSIQVIANGGSILMFPSPVLSLFQQPLSVTCTTNSVITGVANANNDRTVVIDLIGELAIQKAPPGYRGM